MSDELAGFNQGFTPVESRRWPIGYPVKLSGKTGKVSGYMGPYSIRAICAGKEFAASTSLLGMPPAPGWKPTNKEPAPVNPNQGSFEF